MIIFYLNFQNTWAGAMRVCRSIGTELVAVEYHDKDTCVAKLAKSCFKAFSFLCVMCPCIYSENRAVQNLDYWTSGSQKDCPGKVSWCSLDRPVRSENLSWASTHDGDCVSVKYGPNATSTFTKTACDKQMPFICEVNVLLAAFSSQFKCKIIQVQNKGTFGEALQAECMEIWDISVGVFFTNFGTTAL
jgi:Lectin C-type domain